MKVFINGFGRIGRTILRQILQAENADVEVVGINDIAALESCAYLFRYDSVFGPFPGQVDGTNNVLSVDTIRIPFSQSHVISDLDLTGVDVVLECTGKANTREIAERGLSAGAHSVLISGPSKVADTTVVLGANEPALGDAQIVSNASCTTNAIAPLLKVLDTGLGIERGHITTIHCYTGSQPTVDTPGPSLERSRAAAVSMVPTSTSAAAQLTHILPDMQNRLSVTAVRVPCISVSAVDATFQLVELPNEPVKDFLYDAFNNTGIVGTTRDACVSTDMRARPESLILALPETRLIQPTQLRVFGWYDNEWGFSARMIEMARRMAARNKP